MASKTGGMLQDQNLNIRFKEASVGWKTNVSKAPSKRGAALAGRTPLGDLSNSLKPSMNRATRKQSSTLFSPLIEKEAVTSSIALDATKKKNTSKTSLKQQPVGRKALFDISNSGKPQVSVASKRNYNTMLGVVAEVAGKEAVTSSIALDATKKKNTSKVSLKQQPVGRKALFDISNSGKPQVNVASKRNYNTMLGVVAEVAKKEAVTSGIALDATKKKNTSKVSLKQQPVGRKALFDISNSGKPQVNVASKRNYNTMAEVAEKEAVTSGIALDATKKKKTSKASLKQQPAGRKALFDIADEGFLHNHEECIKAQLGDMDMNQCLQMIGLDDGEQKSTLHTPSASFRKEAVKHKEAHDNSDSPLIFLELSVRWRRDYDDWIDSMRRDLQKYVLHDNSDSPPISPEHSVRWRDHFDDDLRIDFDHVDDDLRILIDRGWSRHGL